jgi:ATP-binding cassette subfamily B protein/subfamily B ATP-binding cassette protein MsbA
MIAIVGASGSGKSTVVNLLERFFDATEGKILVGGKDITQINLKELRSNIGLVSQDVFLFSDSIERNIWAGDFSKAPDKITSAARAANATNFIERMPDGFKSRAGDRGSLMSGGEKQRVSIARAILKDAPILILDEATSALDTNSEQEVQRGLDTLIEGRTTIVIAHRLSTVAKADMIIVMKNGEIIESGSHEELIQKRGEYSQLHEIQTGH